MDSDERDDLERALTLISAAKFAMRNVAAPYHEPPEQIRLAREALEIADFLIHRWLKAN